MRRLFLKNLILLQTLNLIVKPVWLLLIDRMAQNMLGSVYGEYYLVLNLTLITNIFLDLGIQNFNNTSIAADASFFKRNFKSLFLLKAFLSSIYILLVLAIGIQSGMPIRLLSLLIGIQVLSTFNLYLRTNINGLHYYKTDSLLSVSDKFFGIVLCLVFYWSGLVNIIYFALAQLIASAITFITALSINITHWKNLRLVESQAQDDKIKSLVKQSLPYALLFTLMNFYTRMDVSMMNWLLPDAVYHGGIYAQSFRLLDAAAMFAMLFAGLLLPMFAKMISEKADLRPLAHMASTMLLLISLSVALASQLMGDRILNALYHFEDIEQLNDSLKVFKNIMLTFVPMSITFVFSTLLTAKKDIVHMNYYAVTAFVCNFAINIFLIPKYQSYGASIGSLLTQSFFAILCVQRCFTLFSFKIQLNEIIRYAIWLLATCGFYFIVKSLDHIFLVLLLFSMAAFGFSLALKIIDVKKISSFLTKARQ